MHIMKLLTQSIVLFILSLAVADDNDLKSFGLCSTPKGEQGDCIFIEDCQYLYDLIRSPDLQDEDKLFLRQSQCGLSSKKILVCCSKKLETQTRRTGISGRRLLPQAGTCGNILSNRIIGGNVTKIDEFPWMALIISSNSKGEKKFYCGGSLINNRYVVTAAHCLIIPEDLELTGVRLGEWDVSTEVDCEVDIRGDKDCALPPIDVRVEKVISHPNFMQNSKPQSNDIALLRLAESVTYTDFIRPICLPLEPKLKNLNLDGFTMDISGWGFTELTQSSSLKLKAIVPVIPLEKCQSIFKSLEIDETQLCAGGEMGVDTCRGDSGGPLIGVDTTNRVRISYYLAGITSFGTTKCGTGFPGVYTKVSHFVDWILENIES